MQKHKQKLQTRLSSLLQRIDHGAHAMLTSIRRPRHDNDIPPTPTGHIAATTPVAGPATLNSVSQHGSSTRLEPAMRVGHNFDRVKNHVQINDHGSQAPSIHHPTFSDDGFLPVNTLRKYNRLYSTKAMPDQHSAFATTTTSTVTQKPSASDAIDNDHERESNTVTATGNIIPERQDDLDSAACALSKPHINWNALPIDSTVTSKVRCDPADVAAATVDKQECTTTLTHEATTVLIDYVKLSQHPAVWLAQCHELPIHSHTHENSPQLAFLVVLPE